MSLASTEIHFLLSGLEKNGVFSENEPCASVIWKRSLRSRAEVLEGYSRLLAIYINLHTFGKTGKLG